jgi:hypothetical protein
MTKATKEEKERPIELPRSTRKSIGKESQIHPI